MVLAYCDWISYPLDCFEKMRKDEMAYKASKVCFFVEIVI